MDNRPLGEGADERTIRLAISHILGYPRCGASGEITRLVESYRSGQINREELAAASSGIRLASLRMLTDRGLDLPPSNDFTLQDAVLDAIATIGATPPRFQLKPGLIDIDSYVAMAYGTDTAEAMQTERWFGADYRCIVPEYHADMELDYCSRKTVEDFLAAKAAGFESKPVLLGPFSLLTIGNSTDSKFSPLALLGDVLDVYHEIFYELGEAGAEWIQLDEPVLSGNLSKELRPRLEPAYERLTQSARPVKIILATYFSELGDAYDTLSQLPVDALHIDMAGFQRNLAAAIERPLVEPMLLSAGLVDGMSPSASEMNVCFENVGRLVDVYGADRLMISPSCPLLPSPEVSQRDGWVNQLSPAIRKIDETVLLNRVANEGVDAAADAIEAYGKSVIGVGNLSPRP